MILHSEIPHIIINFFFSRLCIDIFEQPPESKHECPPGKHPSSMQTVEVFAKPGCSREPRKIPNENSFSAEFRGI